MQCHVHLLTLNFNILGLQILLKLNVRIRHRSFS